MTIQIKIVKQEYNREWPQHTRAAFIKRDVIVRTPFDPIVTIRTNTRANAAATAYTWAEDELTQAYR